MCLRVKNYKADGSHVKIAHRNIMVFKVLVNYDRNDIPEISPGYLRTPYRGGVVSSPVIQVPSFSFKLVKRWRHLLGVLCDVGRGVHSCKTLRKAQIIQKAGWKSNGMRGVIHKAIIPKGSKYIVGHNDDMVSLDLIIGEEL